MLTTDLKNYQRAARDHDEAATLVASHLSLLRANRLPLDATLNAHLSRFEDARDRMRQAAHEAGWHTPEMCTEACK
jgi:hypothetical protein